MTLWAITLLALAVSFRKDRARTIGALKRGMRSLKTIAPGLLAMIWAVGLTLALFPEEQIRALFNRDGFQGFVWVSLAGALISIPGPIAFPMAGALLKLGVSPALLASFITTLTMVGLMSLPVEISYFGSRFAIMRQAFSLAAAVAIGWVMGVLL